MLNMDVNVPDNLSLEERVDMLNTDQKRVYDNIESHLVHQLHHDDGICSCNNLTSKKIFISGVAGTGKSFLIETLKSLVNNVNNNYLFLLLYLKCAVYMLVTTFMTNSKLYLLLQNCFMFSIAEE